PAPGSAARSSRGSRRHGRAAPRRRPVARNDGTSPRRSASRDHRPRLDGVALLEEGVARDELVATDEEHGLAVEPELLAQVTRPQRTWDLDLAPRVVELDLHRRRPRGVSQTDAPSLGSPPNSSRRSWPGTPAPYAAIPLR